MRSVLLAVCCGAFAVWGGNVERVFRTPRFTRGNAGLKVVQEIDRASWITHPDIKDEKGDVPMSRVVRFEKEFESDGSVLDFDVTADERFLLKLDGEFVARGPHRGTVANWTYQSYRVQLTKGKHKLEATVWKLPRGASPLAQMSYRHGFCLKAAGVYDAQLTTGKAKWMAGALTNTQPIGKHGGAWGSGDEFQIRGASAWEIEASNWQPAAVVKRPLPDFCNCGIRPDGWILYPSQLPDQTEARVRPGKFVEGGEMKFPFTVPAGEKRVILWDLDRYICAYPEAKVGGGKGAKLHWRWAEALRGPVPGFKGKYKGNRSEWQGKEFNGYGDRFVLDGRAEAVFSPLWFRCGRWCQVIIEAANEPVVVKDLSLIESRYPLECESKFVASDDPELVGVERISARGMQMCCHEMLFDCPFYEQQMYPGDTRVQLNVISAMTSDDRIIRRAMEIYDLARRDDGQVPFNFPTTGTQEGATYTLCYLGMYPDYVMKHNNRAWLKARLPGYRDSLSAFEVYEDAEGIIRGLPGWSFMDWVDKKNGWVGGWAPGSRDDNGASCEANLFYLAAMQGAVQVERAFGNEHLAMHWQEKSEKLKQAIVKRFFVAEKGLFASEDKRSVFSEHAQCMALLTDVLPRPQSEQVFAKLISTPDLCQASVYFSYYLLETYFKFNRPDLFLKRLDLWKGYVKIGATTCLEAPEYPGRDSRSDCHAWGSHPLWFLRTGIAGIRSAAPFFEQVRVAPQPGSLKTVKASYPHPSGKFIEVDLSFENGKAKGVVTTPVPGTFEFGGQTKALAVGRNEI